MKKHVAAWLQMLLSIGLAIVWIKSATAHLGNPFFFVSSIYKYKLVNPGVGRHVAMILPTLQLVLALCLLFRVFLGGALLGSAGLLTVLAGIQGSALARGLKIDCGCFGGSNSRPIGLDSLGFVLGMTFCAYHAFACFVYLSKTERWAVTCAEPQA